MGTLFFTGFPGFLGGELLPRLLARSPEHRAACLVQSKYADLARRKAHEIEVGQPALEHRIDIVEGDITRPDLALLRIRVALRWLLFLGKRVVIAKQRKEIALPAQ